MVVLHCWYIHWYFQDYRITSRITLILCFPFFVALKLMIPIWSLWLLASLFPCRWSGLGSYPVVDDHWIGNSSRGTGLSVANTFPSPRLCHCCGFSVDVFSVTGWPLFSYWSTANSSTATCLQMTFGPWPAWHSHLVYDISPWVILTSTVYSTFLLYSGYTQRLEKYLAQHSTCMNSEPLVPRADLSTLVSRLTDALFILK